VSPKTRNPAQLEAGLWSFWPITEHMASRGASSLRFPCFRPAKKRTIRFSVARSFTFHCEATMLEHPAAGITLTMSADVIRK